MRAARAQREEWARVLDWLPSGRPTALRREPIAQVIGEGRFTLLEVVTKEGARLEVGAHIALVGDQRIDRVLRRISYEECTSSALSELPAAIKEIVKSSERRFVDWLNRANALTVRLHSLELLPGIGRKSLASFLKARDEKRFESFADIDSRAGLILPIVDILTQCILNEIKGQTHHYLFARPPARPSERA